MFISLVTFFITGLIVSVLAVPLIIRKVKSNSWYGIRLPQTMKNENVWFEVNSIMGKFLFAFGVLISALSLYFYYFPPEDEFFTIYFLLAILIIGTILFISLSVKIARHYNDN